MGLNDLFGLNLPLATKTSNDLTYVWFNYIDPMLNDDLSAKSEIC